jgi:arylsulfatase A-like enzyme/phosphatidylethanolamine-binding protein (PEBP) family uncharacterized protein
MKANLFTLATASFLFLLGSLCGALGHDLATGEEHGHYDWSVKPPEFFLAQATMPQNRAGSAGQPTQAAPFAAFAPRVKVRWDERFLYLESNGLPSHKMMVGITAWQQQVPLPQNYTGANAWQFPLLPVPAKNPVSIKGRFLRGAIALAANGIPIFNPQNNRGEISQEIGELDEWGGHCGRADDYHYHAAPLHLQDAVGNGQPIAYALDGYPIFGLAEPDGAVPIGLDAFNGHTAHALGYHYHASRKYPYVNGGFHGEVVERDGQVDPQPRAQPVRKDRPPMRGAKITGFTATPDEKSFALQYLVNGKSGAVNYTTNSDGSWKFQFIGSDGTKHEETYRARELRGAESSGSPPRDGGGGQERRGTPRDEPPASDGASALGMDVLKKPRASFVLSSTEVGGDGKLPLEYTGDGSGATPPLAWKGAPGGTQSYAIVMDHLAPGNVVKSYWTMWDIPASTTSLPKNAKGVGKVGLNFKGQLGYAPPHSQGPGAKTYVFTVYALSAPPQITQELRDVSRETLLAAIKDKVLASASLSVAYSREGVAEGGHGQSPQTLNGAERPNFIVIMGEAQGWASSSVQMDDAVPGSKSSLAHTPSLEKLAAGGMRFANFYAASPRCTPTRAAFLTGRSPAALHLTFVGEGRGGGESSFSEAGSKLIPAPVNQELPDDETTIPEVLKRAGYTTAHFGKWHVGRTSPAKHGFDENDGPNNNGGPENVENPNPKQAFATAELGMDFMTRQAKSGKPFYLQISHYAGRGGTDARPETYTDVRQRAESERDQRMIGSAAVTQDMDATIGKMLAKLDALGIADRTYFIYTADHGAQGRNANGPLANGKGTVWEGGIRVPLIVRGPGIMAGTCTHVRASTVDLFPTIAAIARTKEPLPKSLEGGSLTALLSGAPSPKVQRTREEFVVHFPHYDKDEQGPASSLLLGNDKLIRPYETGVVMLFDLSKDISEQHDLAKDRTEEAAELDRRLSDYLRIVNAQMPTPNSKFDPTNLQPFQDRKGGKGRKKEEPQ